MRPVGIVAAVAGGGLAEVPSAIAAASPVMQVSVAGFILAVVVVLAWEVHSVAPGVYRALVDLKAREAVRASTALCGMPYFGVVFVFLATYAYQAPIQERSLCRSLSSASIQSF